MASVGVHGLRYQPEEAISSLLLAKKLLQGHNTPSRRRCCSTSTANIRFVSNSLGLQTHPLGVEASIVLAFLGIALNITFGCFIQGFTDMSQ